MTLLTFSVLLLFFSFAAGLLGALTGLGGGVVIIPVLVLLFHIDIHLAMGASLVSVIATSSGSAAAYMREGYTNLRLGMFLEVPAVVGALLGALLVAKISTALLSLMFSLVLFFSAYLTITRQEEDLKTLAHSSSWAKTLALNSTYPLGLQLKSYEIYHLPLGFMMMGIAGMFSGLLGIGSGALNVLAMDQVLKLPYKVATTTSNFMIGITAAASAGIYFAHGYIHPTVIGPVLIGVVIGSFCGAKLLAKIHYRLLRIIFSFVICLVGLQMLIKSFTG
ncbi:MAG: sulfite exporter TauE/SafE family protein [Gammaproteobacteria bacterium]|nr:sulfite exporter TauE/SafE family protein [Gammaproteobacteria bacterium]